MARVKGTAPAAAPAPLFPVREVVLGVFVPALLFGIAIGIALPLIPTVATRLGADLAMAGFVTALLPIGKIVADVPAGALAARLGDRRTMILATGLGLAAYAGAASAPTLWVLQLSIFALGASTAVFQLARHAYLTEITPPENRARVLSTLGGMLRLGYFLGPLMGALVIVTTSLRPAFWLGAGFVLLTLVVLVAVRDSATKPGPTGAGKSVLHVAREQRRLFLTLGLATLVVGAVRGARQTVIPLWGEYLGLDPEIISLVFGLSGALDMVLFYPAGKVMDRYGRLWIAVPSMLLMGLAMAIVPFTGSVTGLAGAAALLGFGNGLGAGIIMTIGADVAPTDSRSAFLGVWRLFQDTGDAAGPLVIAAATALGSLAVGIWITGALGGAAAGALARWVPRYSMHANRTTRRRAGILAP
ncbi:MFS transporter [Ornithinimicrobium tianjinense]|uniref:MFS transporter n=1 Tax=Ornithinimicrobium tianjinense TaxID=1195761 RepID=A0A917BFF1_9MICO|nr:MFS transporter [Ornithinimicrobium tianjinense]GGF40245.1 MFS transporter [Ornithinimicrobium tianjinense]